MERTATFFPWLASLLLASAAAAAQDPDVVVVPAGPGTSVPDGVTEVEFRSEEPGLAISLVPPDLEEEMLDSRPGLRPDAAEPLCTTPCRLRLPNGDHTVTAGRYPFTLAAGGGFQLWDVEDEAVGMYWGGTVIWAFGVAGTVLGAMVLGLAYLNDPPAEPLFSLGVSGMVAGPALIILGAVLSSSSDGLARRRPAGAAVPPVALGPGALVLRF